MPTARQSPAFAPGSPALEIHPEAKPAPGEPVLTKHLVNRAATTDLAAALDLEAYSQGLSIAADDHQEGIAAFFEKRPPRFTGR